MIRKAQVKDISRIAEIIVFGKRVAYRDIFKNDWVSFNELQVISIAKEYHENPSLIENMFVFDDGIVKGVINYQTVADEVEICEFYVEPFFKGEGIGRKLIQHIINEVKTNQKKRIFLWVIKDNLSARKFYEMNGFQECGQTRLIEGTDKIDMCYELKIV